MKRKIVFIISLVCCIIITMSIYIIASTGELMYEFKEVKVGGREYNPMTDAMAFHFNIINYNAKDGDRCSNALHGPLIEDNDNIIMKGYGRYHFAIGTNMFEFIKYCNAHHDVGEINPNMGTNINDAITSGVNKAVEKISTTNISSYDKFMEYQRSLSYPPDVGYFVEGFWDAMKDKPGFDILQDSFVVKKYVSKALSKLNLSDSKYRKAFGKDGSFSISDEDLADNDNGKLVTALLTMVYSNFWVADLNENTAVDIKTGDLIPFLYNIDEIRKITNTEASHALTEDVLELMAKYAYVAYTYGFDVAERTDGFHYWEQEHDCVFGEILDLNDDDITKYQQKYENMAVLFEDEKGNKGSRLLGATVDTIIRGEYNMETQLTAIKAKVNNILSNFEMETTYKDLIAKNYLMVKHMMDNDHINNTIKDYEMGTIFRNETSLSQGQVDEKNTNTALLSDFQLVKVSGKNILLGRNGDTDGDGVNDGDELGPEPTEWSDITSIVKAALKLDTALSEIPSDQALRWETFNDSIKIEWEDAGKSKVKKVLAKLYKYRSNPNLKDTDFDGIEDGNGWVIFGSRVDQEPLNNNFKGSSMTTRDGELNIDFNTDFRYLMHKDTKYNDELAQQSLIMSNLARGETITLKQKNKNYGTMKIEDYMKRLGFNNVSNELAYDEDNIKVNCYIGYKSIDYYGKKRGVIGIFINTNESVEAYRKFAVDNHYLGDDNLYEKIANKVYEKVDISKLMSLEPEYSLDYCYFISGKGIAGGIANEVAVLIRGIMNNKGLDEKKDIYCYTFGIPKTQQGRFAVVPYIKNIINEDDYVTKAVIDGRGTITGEIYNASIYSDFIYNYKKLTKNNSKYTGNYMQVNSIINAIEYLRLNYLEPEEMSNVKDDLAELLSKYVSGTSNEEDIKWLSGNNGFSTYTTTIKNQISNDSLKTASSVKAYWTLAKCLEGLDEKTINQRSYKKSKEEADSQSWSYIPFPCYQKKLGIPINNEVPMYFQTNERWSRFRYGRRKNYTDNEGDDNRVMSRNSGYSYGTFYESACGACAPAMVLSFLYKKYITPMDVRNKLEDNRVFYRDDRNGGAGTEHAVLTASISEVFNVNCQSGNITRTNANNSIKRVLKSLIDGNPVVVLCHGSGSKENTRDNPHSSYFTTKGHYIVLAGVNKDDIANVNMDNFDRWTNDQLNSIKIYVCDPAYYHHKWTRTCTTAYRFSDFTDKTRAGADIFWIYTKDDNATYDNDEQWDYKNKSYTETFDPQKYKEYLPTTREIDNPYRVYNWEEPSWEFLK